MTTVVYHDGMFAADSRSCIGDTIYEEDSVKLMAEVGPFAVVGFAGNYQTATDVIEVLSEYTSVDQVRSLELLKEDKVGMQMIALDYSGQLWYYQGIDSFKLRSDLPFAIGSGAPYATAAVELGKTAEEAVKYAATKDPFTNKVVRVVKIGGEDE